MDQQFIVALVSILIFAAAGVGYWIGLNERDSRDCARDIHCDGDDLERRARRMQ
jgi:hypothetical protein